MPSRVTERLSAARRKRFVGREGERTVFQSAITAPELPFHILHLYGLRGVGKTTLLGEFASFAERHQTPAYYLDARNLEPIPDSFLAALQNAMALAPNDSALQALSTPSGRRVVLIDTYETLEPLDGWLRENFLPQLTDNTLVVTAGRNPPSPAWSADAGWQTELIVLALRNLSPNESRTYLTKCSIPSKEHDAVLNFTHGHPLALSLVADVFAQRPGLHFQPDEAPDVVKTLLERFVQKVPGPAHRAALEACADGARDDRSALVEHVAPDPFRHRCDFRPIHTRVVRMAARPVLHRSEPRGAIPPRPGARSAACRLALAEPGLVQRTARPRAQLLRIAHSADARTGAAAHFVRLCVPAPGQSGHPFDDGMAKRHPDRARHDAR